jgi:hypothetical protein
MFAGIFRKNVFFLNVPEEVPTFGPQKAFTRRADCAPDAFFRGKNENARRPRLAPGAVRRNHLQTNRRGAPGQELVVSGTSCS